MDKGLILGTANFGNPYGISGGLDKQQCFDILDVAWDMGIRWLITARSYGNSEEFIGEYGKDWKVISKGDSQQDNAISLSYLGNKLCAYLTDNSQHRFPSWARGKSVYSLEELEGINATNYSVIYFPFNLIDQRFSAILNSPYLKIARSIFIQGQAFKMPDIMGIPFYHLCWNFVTSHPNVDMVCFGVDSPKQLEDIMKIPQYEIQYGKIGTGEQWIKRI